MENPKFKVEFINPFIKSAVKIINEKVDIETAKENFYIKDTMFEAFEVSVVVGILGDISGQIIYSFPSLLAKKIASNMMLGLPVKEFNGLARNALTELVLEIQEQAITYLKDMNYNVKMIYPAVIIGERVKISSVTLHTLVVLLKTRFGSFEICIGVK